MDLIIFLTASAPAASIAALAEFGAKNRVEHIKAVNKNERVMGQTDIKGVKGVKTGRKIPKKKDNNVNLTHISSFEKACLLA